MRNVMRAVLLLPIYLAAMIAIDMAFGPIHVHSGKPIPVWVAAGFSASALAAVALAIWYVAEQAGRRISQQRDHLYIGVLIGLLVSGLVGDVLSGAAAIALGGRSVWTVATSHIVAYAVFLVALALTVRALDSSSPD